MSSETIVSVLATVLYIWVYPVLLWAPLLLAKRLRALFKTLPPTNAWLPTYLLTMGVAAVPFLAALIGVAAETGIEDGAVFANTLLQALAVIGVGYVSGAPVVGVVGLPRAGIDWDPTGYGVGTWLLLAAGGLWYALLFVVPLGILSLFVALPTG